LKLVVHKKAEKLVLNRDTKSWNIAVAVARKAGPLAETVLTTELDTVCRVFVLTDNSLICCTVDHRIVFIARLDGLAKSSRKTVSLACALGCAPCAPCAVTVPGRAGAHVPPGLEKKFGAPADGRAAGRRPAVKRWVPLRKAN